MQAYGDRLGSQMTQNQMNDGSLAMQFMTLPPRNIIRRGRTQQSNRVKKSNLKGISTHTVHGPPQDPQKNILMFMQQNAEGQDTRTTIENEPNSNSNNNNFFSVNVNMNLNLNL